MEEIKDKRQQEKWEVDPFKEIVISLEFSTKNSVTNLSRESTMNMRVICNKKSLFHLQKQPLFLFWLPIYFLTSRLGVISICSHIHEIIYFFYVTSIDCIMKSTM